MSHRQPLRFTTRYILAFVLAFGVGCGFIVMFMQDRSLNPIVGAVFFSMLFVGGGVLDAIGQSQSLRKAGLLLIGASLPWIAAIVWVVIQLELER